MCQRRAGGRAWELIENINKGQFSGNLVGLFSIAEGEKYRKMSICGATEQPGPDMDYTLLIDSEHSAGSRVKVAIKLDR